VNVIRMAVASKPKRTDILLIISFSVSQMEGV
jgi:hypothetical protein